MRRRPRQRKVAERRELSRARRLLGGCLGLVLVPAIWQILSDTHAINSFIWASPSRVWDGLTQLIDNGSLGPACWSSLRLFLWGFALAAVSGVALGIALGWYRRTRAIVDPWVSMLYAAPRVGLIPIVIAAAGIETRSQIIIVWVSAVFPIIINTAVGVDTVDPGYLRTAQSFLATNRDVLRGIALPGAMPLIFAGLRQGLTAGLIGVVIAEYFLGNGGVGGLIITASGSGETGEAFVGAFFFSVTAVGLTSKRDELQTAADGARLVAAELAYNHGDYGQAQALIDEILFADPYRESVWRLRMRVCAALGDEQGVIEAFRRCREALQELGAEVAPATSSLLTALRR